MIDNFSKAKVFKMLYSLWSFLRRIWQKKIVERRYNKCNDNKYFSAIWTALTRGLVQSSTSSQPRSQSEVVSLASFHTWSIAAPCFERLWSCCRWFFHFFSAGMWLLPFQNESTVYYYKQQTQISQTKWNQESKSRIRIEDAWLRFVFKFKQLTVCCCFPCTIGWLVS